MVNVSGITKFGICRSGKLHNSCSMAHVPFTKGLLSVSMLAVELPNKTGAVILMLDLGNNEMFCNRLPHLYCACITLSNSALSIDSVNPSTFEKLAKSCVVSRSKAASPFSNLKLIFPFKISGSVDTKSFKSPDTRVHCTSHCLELQLTVLAAQPFTERGNLSKSTRH